MKHNPADPHWPDRDRFVLSAGHASMLLYASLHLSGYDSVTARGDQAVPPARLAHAGPSRELRDRGRRDDDRPARPGLRRTASGWRWRRSSCARSSAPTSATTTSSRICSDGDLMEGVASEAASIAGHLRLGRLRASSTTTTRSRSTARPSLAFSTEDVPKRFQAYGWHTLLVEDGNDLRGDRGGAPRRDGRGGAPDADQPADGDRLRLAARRHAQRALRPDARRRRCGRRRRRSAGIPTRSSSCPDEVVRALARPVRARGAAAQAEWQERFDAWAAANPELAAEWQDAWAGRPKAGFAEALPDVRRRSPAISTRKAAGEVMQAFGPFVPTMIGGAADLVHSTFTAVRGRRGLHARARRPQRRLGRARARHGRRGQRARAARRDREAVRLDVLRLHRLHAPADPALGADGARRASGSSPTTRSRSARTARPTSRSSTSPRCARSRS